MSAYLGAKLDGFLHPFCPNPFPVPTGRAGPQWTQPSLALLLGAGTLCHGRAAHCLALAAPWMPHVGPTCHSGLAEFSLRLGVSTREKAGDYGQGHKFPRDLRAALESCLHCSVGDPGVISVT